MTLNYLKTTFWGSLPFAYIGYVSLVSFNVLRTKVCRIRGYFLYPTRFVAFFKEREKKVDLNDFDSIATMTKK